MHLGSIYLGQYGASIGLTGVKVKLKCRTSPFLFLKAKTDG